MADKVKDPVCGMDIRPEEAAASEEHEGRTVYFCSQACHETFLDDPQRWRHPFEGHEGHGSHGHA